MNYILGRCDCQMRPCSISRLIKSSRRRAASVQIKAPQNPEIIRKQKPRQDDCSDKIKNFYHKPLKKNQKTPPNHLLSGCA